MKEFIDKLIERLEEQAEQYRNRGFEHEKHGYSAMADKYYAKQCSYSHSIEIVNQLAEEYKGGWIACSERLPKDDSMCLVTVEYSSGRIEVNYGWFDRVGVSWYVGMHEFRTTNVHAWMPLPAPFKEGE